MIVKDIIEKELNDISLHNNGFILFEGNSGSSTIKYLGNYDKTGQKFYNIIRSEVHDKCFACDSDTVFLDDGLNMILWYRGRLAYTEVIGGYTNVWIEHGVPFVQTGKMVCKGDEFCERPCPKWVEPVEDKYMVIPVVEKCYETGDCGRFGYSGINPYIVDFKDKVVFHDKLMLLSENEKLFVICNQLLRMLKLGIIPYNNLRGITRGEKGIRMRSGWSSSPAALLGYTNFYTDDFIIKEGYVWMNGRVCNMGKNDVRNTSIYVNKNGDLIVNDCYVTEGVSRGEFLRRLI